jgi:hypothetical protein
MCLVVAHLPSSSRASRVPKHTSQLARTDSDGQVSYVGAYTCWANLRLMHVYGLACKALEVELWLTRSYRSAKD